MHTRVAVALTLLVGLFAGLSTAVPAQETKSPNFVVVLVDDMGWRDMSWSGNGFAETPHTEALARRGVVFTQAYASAPNCAPTRACLMSGQYTPRHKVYTVSDERHAPGSPHHRLMAVQTRTQMESGVVTIAEALKERGYATACFGMWNLGRGRRGPGTPTDQGFDVFKKPRDLGYEQNRYFRTPRGGGEPEFLTDRLTDEALGFIESHRDGPFYVYLPTHAVHAPHEPKPDLFAKYQDKLRRAGGDHDPAYAAMIESLDANVGRIVARLKELRIDDDTVIVFMSDNGGTREYTSPLRGGKGQLYEGGLRVPVMMCGPGIRGGRKVATPIASIDLYPTLLEMAHGRSDPNHALDGESLVPLLEGSGGLKRKSLYWHFPCYVGRNGPSSAIRKGRWKLIEHYEGRRVELYDLVRDPSEREDLSEISTDVMVDLYADLIAWRKSLDADEPTGDNPAYDASARPQRGRGARGGGGERRGRARRNEDLRNRGGQRRGRDTEPPAAAAARRSITNGDQPPLAARPFLPFKDRVRLSWDDTWLYVESDGLPAHRMMVGIRAWNQQVPLPQPYTGSNAFRIPLKPRLADDPVSAKTSLFKGAIALAINGVPIFNPIKQDGRTDTFLAGELDEFGGHAGRADDYHYHTAPLHLQEAAGKGNPIAVALDGFSLLGVQERDGREPAKLDALHGHDHAHPHPHGAAIPHTHGPNGTTHYHYHASKEYPYVNGGLRGVVPVENGEVSSQPRARPVRPYTRPLRGARIVDFETAPDGRRSLTYTLRGQRYRVRYGVFDGEAHFDFTDPTGKSRTEVHPARPRDGRRREGGRRGRERGRSRTGRDVGASRPTEPRPTAGSARPNIILMLSDDQAWNGLSVPMHPDVEGSKSPVVQTPWLEKLGAQGMRFSSAYAPAPVCSPTRISLQTGKTPAALHWTKAARSVTASQGYKLLPPQGRRAIPTAETTIGELLRQAGYATAHFGKWHINGGGPGAHGYDVHDGDIGNEVASRFKDPNPVDIFGMTNRAIEFMNSSRNAKKPFYIQMSWHALHSSENALRATLDKYRALMGDRNAKRMTRAAIAEDLDTGVGRLMTALESLGLADDTYVIYMADNGGGGGGGGGKRRGGADRRGRRGGRGRGVLSAGKGSLGEGGIRVPFIIRGPGIQPNSWSHVPITGVDLLPTFAEWAGVRQLPKRLDGGSMTDVLRKKGAGSVKRPREGLVFHFPHYQGAGGPQSSIRVGSFKLVHYYEDDRVALYDLSKDLSEQVDLAKRMPEKASALRQQLDAYLKSVDAQLPKPNPQYDPAKPPTPRRRGRRGGDRESS